MHKQIFALALLLATPAFADAGDDEEMIHTIDAMELREGTPSADVAARIAEAKLECERLGTAEQCYNGFYVVWGVGGDFKTNFRHIVDRSSMDFTAHLGISFFDVLDVGAEGGLLWVPLVFNGLQGGVYAKLQPIKWVYLKGHYYWITGKGPADFKAPTWSLELGTRLNSRLYGNDFTRGYFGFFWDHTKTGMDFYGVRFTLEGGSRLFTVWRERAPR